MLNALLKVGKTKGKRVGRGYGSGKGGHTIGKGTKGHKSRSGYANPRPGFEGGSMPLSRRIPKLKGFSREYLKQKYMSVGIDIEFLSKQFKSGEVVSIASLLKKGLIKRRAVKVKIIGNGDISHKLIFEGINFSASARKLVETAGCTIK